MASIKLIMNILPMIFTSVAWASLSFVGFLFFLRSNSGQESEVDFDMRLALTNAELVNIYDLIKQVGLAELDLIKVGLGPTKGQVQPIGWDRQTLGSLLKYSLDGVESGFLREWLDQKIALQSEKSERRVSLIQSKLEWASFSLILVLMGEASVFGALSFIESNLLITAALVLLGSIHIFSLRSQVRNREIFGTAALRLTRFSDALHFGLTASQLENTLDRPSQ